MRFYRIFFSLIVLFALNANILEAQPWHRASREAAQRALQLLRQKGMRLKGNIGELGARSYNWADAFRRDTLHGITPLQRFGQLGREQRVRLLQNRFSKISNLHEMPISMSGFYSKFPGKDASESHVMKVLLEAIKGALKPQTVLQQKKDKALIEAFDLPEINTEVVERLIDAGANVNAPDEKGDTLLVKTCNVDDEISEEQVRRVEFLINSGADTKVRDDRYEMTVLHLLAKRNQELNEHEEKLIRLLVKNGADLEAKGPFGLRPLFYSVLKSDKKRAELFLKLGANVNVTIPLLKMPKKALLTVYFAEFFIPIPFVPVGKAFALAYRKATIPSRDDMEKVELRGDTPLHIAVRKDDVKMVRLLLKYEADTFAKNYRGNMPFAYIRGNQMEKLLAPYKAQWLGEQQKQKDEYEDVD